MPLQKSRSRRDSSRSTPWRLTMTGWFALNLSATSCALLKVLGETTTGLALAATVRTADLGLDGSGELSTERSFGGRVRTTDPSAAASPADPSDGAGRVRATS